MKVTQPLKLTRGFSIPIIDITIVLYICFAHLNYTTLKQHSYSPFHLKYPVVIVLSSFVILFYIILFLSFLYCWFWTCFLHLLAAKCYIFSHRHHVTFTGSSAFSHTHFLHGCIYFIQQFSLDIHGELPALIFSPVLASSVCIGLFNNGMICLRDYW